MNTLRSFGLFSLLVVPLTLAAPTGFKKRAETPISSITSAQWTALNQSVGGRLEVGYPLAKPCYSFYNGKAMIPNTAQCAAVQNGSTDELYIASQYGGYMNVSNNATTSRSSTPR